MVFRFLYLLRGVVFLYLHAVFVFKAPSKWTFGFGSQRVFRFEAKKKIARKKENTFLACYVLFSQFRHVMFSFMIERHVTAVSTKAMTVNIGITQADSLCNNVDELINRGKIPRNNVWGVT